MPAEHKKPFSIDEELSRFTEEFFQKKAYRDADFRDLMGLVLELGFKKSQEYFGYIKLKNSYRDALLSLKQKGIIRNIGYNILGSYISRKGSVVFHLEEEDDPEFRENLIRKTFERSLEDCLKAMPKNRFGVFDASNAFKVSYVKDEISVYVRLNEDIRNKSQPLAFLHAYKTVI
ncbi:hypothetical protein HYT53_01875 [Candidatus Woesearchaeota archaeon]|nr:hypothetical protein [Candidatus Woesearchaeota archaeon]